MRPSFICAFMTAPLFLQNDSETTRVFVSLINSARVSSCRTLSLSAQKLIYRQLVQLIWLLKFACRALASKSCADMRILYFYFAAQSTPNSHKRSWVGSPD